MDEEEMGNLTIDEVKTTKGQIRRLRRDKTTSGRKEGAADSAAAVFSFTRPQEFSLRPRFPAVPTTSKFTYLSIEQRLLLPKLLLGVVFERLGRNRRWSTRRV